jgi:ribosome biogenesis SPOUT family RNA methylase Rps3
MSEIANFGIDGVAKIVQLADEQKTLPDGSKIVYAESKDKIALYHKPAFDPPVTYVYDRESGKILINNGKGSNLDKRKMIQLGSYLLSHVNQDELITYNVKLKKGA